MSLQSDAAKARIISMLSDEYPNTPLDAAINNDKSPIWYGEYRFAPPRMWRFDYAVPALLCANYLSSFLSCNNHTTPPDR